MKIPTVNIRDIAKLINGKAYNQDDWDTVGLPIIRIQNLNNAVSKHNYWSGDIENQVLVNKGDLLFAWSGTPGTSFGAHIWNGDRAVLNQHIFRVDLDDKRILKAWARFSLNMRVNDLISQAHGGVGLKHVTKGMVDSLSIPLPPLPEQRRIAAILDNAEALRAKRRAALAKLDMLAQSIFMEMFGDPATNPKGWPIEFLSDLTRAVQVGVVIKPASHYADDGVIALRSLNVKFGGINLQNIVRFNPHAHKTTLSKSILKSGDVVVVRTGAPGVAAVVPEELDGINCIDLIIVRPDHDKLNSVYFSHLMNSEYGIKTSADGTNGAAQQHLNVGTLSQTKFPAPTLSSQRAFAQRIEVIESLKAIHLTSLAKLDTLFASLQHRAFRGEL